MTQTFLPPSALERTINRLFGAMVRLGLALPHNYLLIVRGRKSGKLYSAPVDLLTLAGDAISSVHADAHNGCAMPRPPVKLL